jgi:glycosyltransferase involved in cell wall biosynthesis
MKPHYILDARTATPHFPGIGRYVTNLARALMPLLAPDERLTVICDPAYPIALPPSDAVRTIALSVSPFSLRQQWAIPRLLRSFNVRGAGSPASSAQLPASSLYHSPYIAMPYLPGIPSLLTVYDLIPVRYPAYSSPQARFFIRWMTRLALRAVRHVIAISEFTRRDFMVEFGLRPEQITAIPLAADPVFQPQPPEAIAAVRARYNLPERFVLYLGSNKPHKNLTRLVEAWRIADSKWPIADSNWQMAGSRLVIAGAWDEHYPEARQLAMASTPTASTTGFELRASSHQLPVWLGRVPEADLPALYGAATAFVFPSLYEGFGLPVLEAMACGTPVICSNTSSLPEVAGSSQTFEVSEASKVSQTAAALLVDPLDTAALADALRLVLTDDGLRTELRRRGLARAAHFTWQQTAAATLAIYRQEAHRQE